MIEGTNSLALQHQERLERRRLLSLSIPAIVLIAFICLIPVGCLFVLSFSGDQGFTLVHYERIFTNASYLKIFRTTFVISVVITTLAIVIGYPLAYYITTLPDRLAAVCLGLVLIPFWTSLLVRTYAWLVLLQRQGLINDALLALNIINEPIRLVYNWTGSIIGMLHIMLPFFILPTYAAMKAVDRDLLRASASLGASPVQLFWTVFVPLTIPGVLAGSLLVFVYCLGFYVTPAILGGGRLTMVATKVEQNATVYSDWGAASSLGLVLLILTFGFFWIILKLIAQQERRVN